MTRDNCWLLFHNPGEIRINFELCVVWFTCKYSANSWTSCQEREESKGPSFTLEEFYCGVKMKLKQWCVNTDTYRVLHINHARAAQKHRISLEIWKRLASADVIFTVSCSNSMETRPTLSARPCLAASCRGVCHQNGARSFHFEQTTRSRSFGLCRR